MMPAGRFCRFDFLTVNPLFQRGIADSQNIGGFAWRQESLHVFVLATRVYDFVGKANTTLVAFGWKRPGPLVSQRLSRFQREGNAFLGLLLTAQRHKRFPPQIDT